ncbi:MAG: plasmid pRiA4b ORF-3 family protein [Deltaproteobacteria bacterium]|nr:plasmid pRiA4b ORF-3 family protein [Deltaproteobacteria bacterium]
MPRYYELEVSLQEIQPRIWRRFLIRTTATFAQLHQAIQDSFGWQDYHLWEFRLPSHRGLPIAGLPDDDEHDRPTPDAKAVKLSTYFTGARVVEWCEYLYDFGDDWVHDVKLIAVHSEKESFKRRLLAGERAAPPEDCGGIPGYEQIVHFVATGEDILDDDPERLETWLGGWRPDRFDLTAAKQEFDR